MNKLAVVFGVAAVATLAGCKDPEYARIRPGVQDEPKSVETEPVVEVVETPVAEVADVPVDVKDDAPVAVVEAESAKCTCPPGTRHDQPCKCGAPDCQCVVEEKPAEPEYTVYIVQRGDYLSKISKKFNIKIDAIKKLNDLKSDNIKLGQKLKLPGKVEVGAQEIPAGAVNAAPAKKPYESYKGATKDYVVVAGDSLGKIAYSNGMNIRQLKELNGLKGDVVYIGQKLKIADKAAAPVAAEVKPVAAEAKPVAAESRPVAAEVKAVPEPNAEDPVSASVVPPKADDVAAVVEGSTDYIVQDGDDLPTIAIEFRVPVARLRELNNLGEGDSVKPGQVLKIPTEQ